MTTGSVIKNYTLRHIKLFRAMPCNTMRP